MSALRTPAEESRPDLASDQPEDENGEPLERAELLEVLGSRPQLAPLAEHLLDLLAELRRTQQPPRLAAQSAEGGLIFVDVDDIDWIDAAGKHCRLNSKGESYLIRVPIGSLEKRLDPTRFPRIHRSTIVNLDRVREIRPRAHGHHVVVLENDVKLNLTRSARRKLIDLLLQGQPVPATTPASA